MNELLAYINEEFQAHVARIRELEAEIAQLKAERDHFEIIAIEAQIVAQAAKKALADQLRAHDRERRKWANMGR